MSEGTNETMLRRIEHLERSNRAMKFIALGAIVASVALNAIPALALFPHGPKAVDAQSYNLVTAKGVLVATLGQTANGGYLAFFDAKGKPEMLVGAGAPVSSDATAKSLGVAVYDGNALFPGAGDARQVWAMSTAKGVTTIGNSIYDGNAKVRLSSVTASDGSNAGSFFYDANPLNAKSARGYRIGQQWSGRVLRGFDRRGASPRRRVGGRFGRRHLDDEHWRNDIPAGRFGVGRWLGDDAADQRP